jgi:uncharacterized protein (TIGR02246 family)
MPARQPEEMPAAFTAAFNSGDVNQLMALYEADAVIIPQPGQVARGTDAVRQALTGFLALKLPIHMDNKRVLTVGDVALISNTWKVSGTGPDGSQVDLGGTSTELVRRQSDGSWRYVIDDPYSVLQP